MKKILITGNLGKDPEKKFDGTGNQFVTFSVGVGVGNKENPKTDWVDVSCNGKLAELASTYLTKGAKVLVSGFPSVNAYVNKENKAVGVLRIYADNIEFLSAKADGMQNQSNSNEVVSDVSIMHEANKIEADHVPF